MCQQAAPYRPCMCTAQRFTLGRLPPSVQCVLSFNSQLEPEKHVDEALAALKQLGVLKA
jgi:hypothetical protein